VVDALTDVDPGAREAPAHALRRFVAVTVIAAAIVGLVALGGHWIRGGEAASPALTRVSGIVTAAPASGNTAIYLSLTNEGGADELIGVQTAVASRATLHDTSDEDGFVTMSDRQAYPIPGDSTTVFRPGGAHVMLDGLTRPLVAGDRMPVTLLFEKSAPIDVVVEVVEVVDVSDIVDRVGLAGDPVPAPG